MTSFCNSIGGALLALPGVASVCRGVNKVLRLNEVFSGVHDILSGSSVIQLGAKVAERYNSLKLRHLNHFLLKGTASIYTIQGLVRSLKGIKNLDLSQIMQGVLQFLGGTCSFGLLERIQPLALEMGGYAMNVARISQIFGELGIVQFKKRNYVKGIAGFLSAAIGAAVSVYVLISWQPQFSSPSAFIREFEEEIGELQRGRSSPSFQFEGYGASKKVYSTPFLSGYVIKIISGALRGGNELSLQHQNSQKFLKLIEAEGYDRLIIPVSQIFPGPYGDVLFEQKLEFGFPSLPSHDVEAERQLNEFLVKSKLCDIHYHHGHNARDVENPLDPAHKYIAIFDFDCVR